ncbi:MAG: dehydrogenase E1 component subunit alpha/beta [Acidobacteria bacterium]|nr:dehydrogenase E1 component subunit alpha/beta [Acidobacteriota bacterium]
MATATQTLPTGNDLIVPPEVTLELYRKLLTVYFIEERMKSFVKQGKCSFHASTRGHEKLQLGMTMLLKPGYDWFFTYYRSKAIAVGLGMPVRDIFLGMLSREGDPNSNGRNMPEHWSSKRLRLVSQTAVTGTQYLNAVGMARAIRAAGGGEIVHVSSGDGATSEGEFFEALNWAQREKLPVLFLVQNNGFAISTRQHCQTAATVRSIAQGFGMPAYHLDGTSFDAIYQAVPPVVAAIRAGEGPALIEASVVRLDPHSSSDDQRKYRDEAELRTVNGRDPLLRTERYLVEHGLMTAGQIVDLRREIQTAVDAAAAEADAQPAPTAGNLMAHIFADDPVVRGEAAAPAYVSAEPVTMIDAINHGLKEEMERNPKMMLWGEDVADPKGGVFGVTRGLSSSFPGRVFNSPLAEASIAGVAAGMAIGGYKPVVEMQFGDYLWPAALQLREEIPTVRWRSQGEWSCPMTLRVAVGGYIKGGPWHSACVESFFAHIPGWYVAFPSNAEDAKGLIKAAARAQDPVVFLEHKALYRKVQAKSPEPSADYVLPFGHGRVAREGTDVTIVTWGSTVYQALELARQMSAEGRSLEVLDMRTLVPLDEELIYRSVHKTSRAIVLHEDSLTMGFGAEIAARIAENAIDSLDAPLVRVAAKDSFVPSAPNLETAVLPAVDDLRRAVERVLRY